MECNVEELRVWTLVLREHFRLNYVLKSKYLSWLVVLQFLRVFYQQKSCARPPVRQLTPNGPIDPMNNFLQILYARYAIG